MVRLLAALLAIGTRGEAACLASGRVSDPSGAPVPDATVALSASQLNLASSRSGADGAFTLGPLPCGRYLLSVQHASFAESRLAVSLSETNPSDIQVTVSLVPVEEQITVTATAGGAEAQGEVPQRVTVVARSSLAEHAHTVLTEAAREQVGVHEQRTAPAMGSFFIRGLTGKNVSVYRDGFRYTTSAMRGGVSTFQNLVDPAVLDSIEFVRGPDSAQYGSDSLGGTVNLLSTFALAPGRKFAGEFAPMADWASGAVGSHLLASYAVGRLQAVATLAARRVNTVRPARGLDSHSALNRFLGLMPDPGRLPDTAFTQYGGSLHAQYRMSAAQSLVMHYERGQQDGAKRYDQLLGGDGNRIADLRNLMLDFGYLRYQRLGAGPLDRVSVGASFHADREERVNQGGQGDPLATIAHQYEKLKAWGLTLQTEDRSNAHSWTIGGEAYHERVAAPAFSLRPATGEVFFPRARIPDGARYLSHGLYAQDVWRPLARLRLTGALRFGGASYQSHRVSPSDSLTANAVTGRAGASLRAVGNLFLHAQYARGFRAPNLTDLGTLGLQGNGAFEANPNDVLGRNAMIGDRADDRAQPAGRSVARLRPETSDNFDFGASLRHRRVRAEFTLFRMHLGNSIASQTLLLPAGAVGQALGDQIVSRQLPSGAVFVPISTGPVLVRGNLAGARLHGIEQTLRVPVTARLTFNQNLTWVEARDQVTGLPPDLEPGIPPLTVNPSLLYTRRRFWVEAYGVIAGRQDRLSSLALADRRMGAARSRANIASFFQNGARVRGFTANGRLLATGETLADVQNRVLGTASSAPLFTAIPGYGLIGFRTGVPMGESGDLFAEVSNLADKTYRGIGWGVPGTGRSLTVRYRLRF